MVGSSYRIHAQNRDPHRTVFDGNAVNVDGAVILDRMGEIAEIGAQALALDLADEHFGETGLVGLTGDGGGDRFGIVNRDGGFIQIALELKAGGVDEAFVVGIMRHRRQLTGDVGAPHPLQIDVGKSVGGRKQTGRLRRGMFAEHDHQGDGRSDQRQPLKGWGGCVEFACQNGGRRRHTECAQAQPEKVIIASRMRSGSEVSL